MMKELESADGMTCDLYFKELVNQNEPDNNYTMTGSNDMIAFFMGKLDLIDPSKNWVILVYDFWRIQHQSFAYLFFGQFFEHLKGTKM